MLTGPIVAGVAEGIAGSGGFLTELARTLAWTPAGAALSLGGELAVGHYGAAALKFLIAVGYARRPYAVLECPAAAGTRHTIPRGRVEEADRRPGPVRGFPGDADRGDRCPVPELLAA